MKRVLSKIFILAIFITTAQLHSQTSIPIKVYLEGSLKALNNGSIPLSSQGKPLMRDNLRLNPFTGQVSIPVTDPYYFAMTNFDLRPFYTHVGDGANPNLHAVSNPSTVFAVTGDNAIVDWVFVEIRSKMDSTEVLSTRSGLVQRDGDVVDLDGVSNINFASINETHYYVVVRHRNHLGVMSKLVPSGQLVDFTLSQTPVFDLGQINPQINYTGLAQNNEVVLGYAALRAGDANGDGKVKVAGSNDDASVIFSDVILHPSNTTFASSYNNVTGYYNSDIDMDGKSKFTSPDDDFSHVYNQVLFYPINTKVISNFGLSVQQIPVINE